MSDLSPGTITLLIYLIVLVPLMLLGFFFARRKQFTAHKYIMTTIVIANWVLIAAVMANSYRGVVEFTTDFGDINFLLPTVHLLLGTLAQLLATYLVILMWTENTPLERIVVVRIKNIKTPMRITLSLWLVTVLLGVGIYAVFNSGSSSAEEAPSPAVTEEATEDVPDLDATEEATEDDDNEPDIDAAEEAEEATETAEAPDPAVTEAAD